MATPPDPSAATATPLILTPPDPIPAVAPAQAVGLVPVSPENKGKLEQKVDAFVADVGRGVGVMSEGETHSVPGATGLPLQSIASALW